MWCPIHDCKWRKKENWHKSGITTKVTNMASDYLDRSPTHNVRNTETCVLQWPSSTLRPAFTAGMLMLRMWLIALGPNLMAESQTFIRQRRYTRTLCKSSKFWRLTIHKRYRDWSGDKHWVRTWKPQDADLIRRFRHSSQIRSQGHISTWLEIFKQKSGDHLLCTFHPK